MVPIMESNEVGREYRIGANRLTVLTDVTVQIAAGETVAIVGPSGAGKSTLLHILGGLDRPTRGTVHLGGEDLYALSASRRTELRAGRIGFVFQSYHLLPELDVVGNVELPAMARRGALRRASEIRRRAMELLSTVGLEARWNHTPLELSGGEQQRVALARALMNDPEIVLADEPTGNLDTATGEQVLRYLFELTRERGHTLVMVTHNEQVATRCHRVLRMKDGRMLGETSGAGAR